MDWMHIVQNTVVCSIVHHHDSFDNMIVIFLRMTPQARESMFII